MSTYVSPEIEYASAADMRPSGRGESFSSLTPRSRSSWGSLYWMFFVALAVRLALSAVMLPEFLDPFRDHWHFGWEMGRIARSICQGQGFSSPFFDSSGPTAMLPPVYPYLVAGCMKLFGGFTAAAAMAILTLNSVFAAVTVIPIYFLARRMFDERTAIIAGWAWVFFPYSIYLSGGRIYSDTLTCMIASFLWLQAIRLKESRAMGDWLLWGILWGVAGLVSPVLLGPLPFLAIWLLVRRRRAGLSWFSPALLAAFMFLTIVAPWTIRNYVVFHRFVPLRDGFWMEVHVGYNGDTSDVTPDSAHPTTSQTEYGQWRRLGEIGYMDAKKAEALAYIRQHPRFFVWVLARHVLNTWTGFWSLDPKFLADEPFHVPNVFFATAMTLLLLGGVRYAWIGGRREAVFPLVLVLLSFPIVYYITHSSMDYRHPLDPIIVIMNCYCVVEWRRQRSAARSVASVNSLLGLGIDDRGIIPEFRSYDGNDIVRGVSFEVGSPLAMTPARAPKDPRTIKTIPVPETATPHAAASSTPGD